MLQKLFTKPVELSIDGKTITFNSIDDFEFALDARSTIPLHKISDALKATPGQLDMESNAIVIAIEQISELINQSSAPGEITRNLKTVNSVIFSSDNDWRDIFFALKKDFSAESSLYKQSALKVYLQYLTNRQQMIQSLKDQLQTNTSHEDNAEELSFNTGELDLDEEFDSKILADKLGMTGIGKGQSVLLDVNEGDVIALLLASYQCRLVIKNGIRFVDHCAIKYPMTTGDNKIGRGSECKVRFVDTMQRISRLHLIITVHNKNKIELTDLSTYGTHYKIKSSS